MIWFISCYATGRFGSREIEGATYRDVSMRYLCAGAHPDHDTICAFRRENRGLFERCFVKVLELAREVGVLKVGAVDAEGSMLIVGRRVSDQPNDKQPLQPTTEAIPAEVGKPQAVLTGPGFYSEKAVEKLEADGSIQVYAAVGKQSHHRSVRDLERKQDAPPPSVATEWALVTLAYNFKRLHKLMKPLSEKSKPSQMGLQPTQTPIFMPRMVEFFSRCFNWVIKRFFFTDKNIPHPFWNAISNLNPTGC